MVCRNKDKAEEARVDIVKESGNTVSVVSFKTMDDVKWGWAHPMVCEK